jgi:hypothetical protein
MGLRGRRKETREGRGDLKGGKVREYGDSGDERGENV